MARTLASMLVAVTVLVSGLSPTVAAELSHTRVRLVNGRWTINGRPTNPGSAAEGLLLNVRMVNAVFEDRNRPEFDPEANTDRFLARIPDYAAHGVNAFTICLQGGMPGYEGAVNSAFAPDGSLRAAYLARVERIIRTCDRHGVVVILGLYYQRQSAILRDEATVRTGVVNAARWVREHGFQNVLLEIANEYPHTGFVHGLIRNPKGQAGLIRLAKETAPGLLVSASGYGDGLVHQEVAEAADFLLPHWNNTPVGQIPARIATLKRFGKPIVCNEDDKTGTNAVAALRASVAHGVSYGLMLKEHNQTFPFHVDGATDDPVFYAQLRALTTPPAAITATREGDSVVRVVSAGLFETTVTRRKGFVSSFWDLEHDADKKFDLGPVLDENGILWTKCGFPNELEKSDGSWYAAPCERLELLESGPARVRVRTSGPHCRYGNTDVKARWNGLGFEQTFTMYPSGATYVDYCLVAERPLRLHDFLLIIKSNGSWGNRGKGEGKGEVHCASESGDKVEYGKGSCLALQWSDGPTHFQDFLMVLHTGKFGRTYWNEGYEDKDIRAGLNLVSRWPGGQLPAGRDHILLLFCFGQNINSSEAARQYAEDYQKPDTLTVTQGAVVTNDAGDFDSDGFNEAEGCYVLRATPRGVEFTLHGAKTPRESPVFKVKEWAGAAPATVTLGAETLTPGEGFVSAVEAGQLILQILRQVKRDVPLAIPAW